MEIALCQQYNVGEKPTVILYTYINRHAGTPEKQYKQNRDNVQHNGGFLPDCEFDSYQSEIRSFFRNGKRGNMSK